MSRGWQPGLVPRPVRLPVPGLAGASLTRRWTSPAPSPIPLLFRDAFYFQGYVEDTYSFSFGFAISLLISEAVSIYIYISCFLETVLFSPSRFTVNLSPSDFNMDKNNRVRERRVTPD